MEIEIKKYNDPWLDNGLATFYGLLKEVEEECNCIKKFELDSEQIIYSVDEIDDFIEEMAYSIKNKFNKMIVNVVDKKTGERKEVKKDHILIQEGKKIRGKVAFKEKLFDAKFTEEIIRQAYQNLDGDKIRCFFCNRTFEKNIKKLQQASYPFVTKIKTLSGIRSGEANKLTEYITEYCPQCYLVGVMEWLDDSIVYRNLPGDKSILILPNKDNLDDLVKLKNSYKGILNNEERWSNIKIDKDHLDVENTSGRYTTFLSFYENFLRYVNPDFDNNNWFVIEIPQSGSVKNPKYFNILLGKNISKVLKILIRQDKAYYYRIFVKQFYAFYTNPQKGSRDFEREKVLHEKLCEKIIKDDFNSFASTFVPRKGIRVGIPKESYQILDKLIYYWRIKPMQIENKEEYLKTLGMAGSTLANLIGGRLGLFFKLEKSQNPTQFFEALQEITRRVVIDDAEKIGKIYSHSIEKISQMIIDKYDEVDGKEFFNTTKNILLIYMSLRSKRENQSQKEVQND